MLLTGDFAYKIKRPVRFDFIDLTSAEQRAFLCAEEVRLNRRFAPQLYVEVSDIRESSGGGARIGGDESGPVIERAVRMRQFPSERQLDRLLEAGRVAPEVLHTFGRALAKIHATLPVSAADEEWGTPAVVRRTVETNLDEYLRAASQLDSDAPVDEGFQKSLKRLCETLVPCMEARRARGRIRECHGDLHTRNIALLEPGLVAFDCLEFQPAFRWIDVAEEIALLLADLGSRGQPRHAHAFLSGYLAESGDYQACRILPLYRAHRALVRAKVNALEVQTSTDEARRAAARARHDQLLREAQGAVSDRTPRIILMAGLSGSGKTWLATRLAPELGAIHIRSDVERKRGAGLNADAQSASPVGGGLYAPENTSDLYDRLVRLADDALAGGFDVIIDATFLKRATRELFRRLAVRNRVPIDVIQCEAPVSVLRERIKEREHAGQDASEADLAVLEWQLREREPIHPGETFRVTRIDTKADNPLAQAMQALISAPDAAQ